MAKAADSYKQLLEDITASAKVSLRPLESVKLVVVSKGHSVAEIRELYEAGCRVFGESRVQEALIKREALPKDIEWHLIGSLQKNKVAKAIQLFDLIHSVDSVELAEVISAESCKQGKTSAILIQVNTSLEESKHGFFAEDFLACYPKLQALPNIRIEGLMTIAPKSDDCDEVQASFNALKSLADTLKLKELSMGMSQDYPLAINAGATLLRIGSKAFS